MACIIMIVFGEMYHVWFAGFEAVLNLLLQNVDQNKLI
jgi:hypothetical protein